MGRKKYIWQNPDWPKFFWDTNMLLKKIGLARKAQGKIVGEAAFVGLETHADLLVEEAFSTSAIEGESLDRSSIRSSVARRLGLPTAGFPPGQRHIDGLVEMLIDATSNFDKPLSIKRLQSWQASLFPTGYSNIRKIKVGKWRTDREPMRVISGPAGKEKIHFEAPLADRIPDEITAFLKWWKHPPENLDGIIRAGIAHFWFVTIHPFEDGNGRISRAITDMAIAQDEKSSHRLYSLSSQIIKERDVYYEVLEKSQKQTCDITMWLDWFLKMYIRAIESSEETIQKALVIAKFWQLHKSLVLNDRQIKIVQKLLEAEPQGFEGGLNNRKYVSMTKTSRETAKRELSDLEGKGILVRNPGGGRSTSYSLNRNRKVPTLPISQ